MNSSLNIIISGGGTGGHLTPAFAIADAFRLKNIDTKIRFIGSINIINKSMIKE